MKNTVFFIILFMFNGFACADIQLHCKGKVNIFISIDDELREFKGWLVWDLDGDSNNYISFSGHYLVGGKSYQVNRAVRANVVLISGTRNLFEVTPVKTIVQTMDELPPEVGGTFMFKQPRVYRIQKTLAVSYLISNAYAPVFICHET